jgi:hypothetical protein
VDNIDTSNEIWKGKVVRYRKWEQRHDRSVDPLARKNYGKILAEFYVDLSNTAREIVKRAGREHNARFSDFVDNANDETFTRVNAPSARYRLKYRHEEPNRLWFQRNEHEPWFDLGYFNDKTGEFSDVPDKELVMRNRLLDMQRSPFFRGVNHAVQANHIHVGPGVLYHAPLPLGTEEYKRNQEKAKMYERPEDLEAAAAHAMARAAELRALDDREPTGEEATISWTWADEYEGAKTYTFVAFRSDEGLWYATGNRICRDGVKWRELALGKFGKALREGRFFLVTEWSQIGDE